MTAGRLRIGYLMQNGAPALDVLSGPQLHTRAVIDGLRALGHEVRTVAIQHGALQWSADLQTWSPTAFGFTARRPFRLVESVVRRVQSELRLPFVCAFDSVRFGDACVQHLSGCDVLYERHGYMGYGGVVAARRLGVPHVLELNGNILREIDELGVPMSRVQRELSRRITVATLRAAHVIVVVSEGLRRVLVRDLGIPSDKVTVVINGVDVEAFAKAGDPTRARAAFDLGRGPVVAFVGSFQPWHGVDLLIEAFGLLRRQRPDALLALVGDGPGADRVRSAIARLGLEEGVRMLGHLTREGVAAVLGAADVAVAPYPYRHADIVGTPLKVMEYMAAGRAIVASTAPLHEVVVHGQTGLRVAPGDPEALAQGMREVLDSHALRSALGARARDAAQDFSWGKVLGRLSAVLQEAVGRQSLPRATGSESEPPAGAPSGNSAGARLPELPDES